jgi:hypothetical protein
MEELDRVRAHTDPEINDRLDEKRLGDVAALVDAPPAEITRRLHELDREWDVERTLEANAAALTLLSLVLGATRSRGWFALSAAVPAFLLQHAVQGWCPPLAVLRRLNVRTRREIDAERTALKGLRGDFDGLTPAAGDATAVARRALDAAGRRLPA